VAVATVSRALSNSDRVSEDVKGDREAKKLKLQEEEQGAEKSHTSSTNTSSC
jgi:DNA-binding LacI/PurR family transcriptional regulator